MRIGVVCSSDERFSVFQRLVGTHSTCRISPEALEMPGESALFDWVFIDGLDYPEALPLAERLRSKSFVLATDEQPVRPCVIRYDDSGHIHLQCGRQSEARCRAENGIQSAGTSTLVFQHAGGEK